MAGGHESDAVFAESVPEFYDRYLVPLLFKTYADDLAARVAASHPASLLEVAAGTGVVTRALCAQLPPSVAITATDLNQPMVDHAMSVGTSRPVDWRAADVMSLPFSDAGFDVVVCQFGAMFFPDRAAAFAEVARVLRPGGVFLLNVWAPHGYYDEAAIRADDAAAGFATPIGFEALEAESRAPSCDIPAFAYCQGTPLRNEIEARDPQGLVEATEAAAAAIGKQFGQTDITAKIRAFVISATKP